MLETEYMLAVESSIQTEVELALEGASNEALKIFSSARMSDVKDDMREGIELYNKGQYKKAVPLLNKSVNGLKAIRRDIASVQNFPLSSMLSPLYSLFTSVPKMFAAFKDPMLQTKFQSKIGGQATANVLLRLFPLIPGITLIPGLTFAPIVFNEQNRIRQWSSNKKHAPEQIGSYFNDVRSDLLYLIDIYIDNAEEILHKASTNIATKHVTESYESIIDELF